MTFMLLQLRKQKYWNGGRGVRRGKFFVVMFGVDLDPRYKKRKPSVGLLLGISNLC